MERIVKTTSQVNDILWCAEQVKIMKMNICMILEQLSRQSNIGLEESPEETDFHGKNFYDSMADAENVLLYLALDVLQYEMNEVLDKKVGWSESLKLE